ncbi:MAG TPA: hypothetical protein VKT70_10455, partial [Stellaceae bacterium]|nr:hypothetical protein [Stellaceae bacterium]
MRQGWGCVGATIMAALMLGSAWAEEPAFEFTKVTIESNENNPEACLGFSKKLDPNPDTHYADYVKITPQVAFAARVNENRLCLGNLDYGTDYQIELAAGLPAAGGERTKTAGKIPVTIADRAPLVSISGDGYILPRGVSNGLAIGTVNVEHVKIRVLRLSDRLLASYLESHTNRRGMTVLAEPTLTPYELRLFLQDDLNLVWSGEMTVPMTRNRTVETAFPLEGIIKPDHPGAYLVIAE